MLSIYVSVLRKELI